MSRPSALDLPANVSARRLETSRGSFAVLDAAPVPGVPPLGAALLVPGFTGSKEDFLDLLAPLTAAGFRVVAVDGRGQYQSGGPGDESAYAQQSLAADVLAQSAAIREEYGPGPLHLLGHSLGGHIVRAAVLSAGPSAWTSLTLMSSGPAEIAPDQQVRTRLLVDHLPTMDMETAWRAMRAMDTANAGGGANAEDGAAAGSAPSVTDSNLDEDAPAWLDAFLHQRWVSTVPEQLIATAKQLMTEPDRVDELAAVPLPKLVLSGEVDYAWPVPSLDLMAKRLDAERVVVKGAGHSPNAERPAGTAAALVAFWSRTTGPSTGE